MRKRETTSRWRERERALAITLVFVLYGRRRTEYYVPTAREYTGEVKERRKGEEEERRRCEIKEKKMLFAVHARTHANHAYLSYE